jgi:anaerobic dimethyl sulfoxide reductase subunit A
VGAVAEYGTSELTKPAPLPPVSLKPPLSPEVDRRVRAITDQLVDRHADETIVYATDRMGCMADTCILRVRVKDGIIKAVESDDTVNVGSAREEVSLDALKKGQIQQRICTVARAWRAKVYDPARILYPMKNVGKRGEDRFIRISWTEALDTIAANVKQIKEKYGPYSIYSWPLGAQFGCGVESWGENSHSGHTIEEWLVTGDQTRSTDPPTESEIFRSKLVVMWGRNPVYIERGTWPYFLVRAKEEGTRFISIDPRYTASAETLNAQWIPIRPGSDLAMALAVAHVLLKEDLYDRNFVNEWAEPVGFAKFRDYVLGAEDGVEKNPEWAERLCGVPAATIREFARLYAQSKPTMLLFGWAACRSMSTNVSRVILYLPVLTGNLHEAGGGHPFWGGYTKNVAANTTPSASSGRKTLFKVPILFNGPAKYPDTILLRDKVDAGELTTEQYNGIIGNKRDNTMLPNIQLLVFGDTVPSIQHTLDSSKRIKAIKKVQFTFGFQWTRSSAEFRYMDIVLPKTEPPFEENGGFTAGGAAGLNNYFVYRRRVIKPPGEVRPTEWAYIQLAKRLGVDMKYNPVLCGVVSLDEWDADKWDAANEEIAKTAYEAWTKRDDVAPTKPPDWEEFKKKQVLRFDAVQKGNMSNVLAQGKNPYLTSSGKIEIYSKFLEDPEKVANTVIEKGAYAGCCLGSIGPAITPLPKWHDNIYGTFHDNGVTKYPLVVLSPNSYMRHHSALFGVPWLNGDCYRHSCWISVADAKARGIKDGDLVRVYSSVGEMIIPAYVTSRTVPGVVSVYHGGFYQPSGAKTDLMPDGVDRGGNQNFLIEDNQPGRMRIGPTLDAGLCQVEKL